MLLVGSFVTGYLLSTLVLFPAPETAGSGVPIPDLYGLSREEAEGTLVELGLDVGRTEALASMDVPAGAVLAQSPVPGQELRPGASVDLTLSSGPPVLLVPALQGLAEGVATDMLEQSGFEVAVQRVPSNLPEGTVAQTDPAAGRETPMPASVTLFVSQGAPRLDSIVPPGTVPGGVR